MKLVSILSFFIFIIVPGCTKSPEPILFGVQECAYCRMTITDRSFAAQIVTNAGRTFSFDAIECMLSYSQKSVESPTIIQEFLVADWNPPHTMLNAKDAFYVVSESIPSPMGGNLSAYSDTLSAENQLKDTDGKVYHWESLWDLYLNRGSSEVHQQ